MSRLQHSTVIGVFGNYSKADLAVSELLNAGFANNQIGIASRDPNKEVATTTVADKGTKAGIGAAAGAVAGAGIGSLVGLGVLAGLIPGIGPAIAAGTLGVILANAAGGAAITGLAGALVGMGIPDEEAKHYEGEFRAGRTVVTVQNPGSRYDEAWEILYRNGAYNKGVPAGSGAV